MTWLKHARKGYFAQNMSNLVKAVSSVFGSILVTLAIGSYQCFGNMMPYTVSYIRAHGSPSDLTYMNFQTVYIMILVFETPSMIMSGYLDEYLGLRSILTLACSAYTVGYILTAYCLNLHFVFVAFTCGILGGIAVGLSFNCIGLNSTKWFPNNKATASAISTVGMAISPVIFSPIQTAIINPQNMLANHSVNGIAETYFSQSAVISRVPSAYIILAVVFALMCGLGTLMIFDREKVKPTDEQSSSSHEISEPLMKKDSSKKESRNETIAILSSKPYWILTIWLCFASQYPVFMMMNFKTYGQLFLLNDSALTYIGSTSSLSGAIGRIIYGCLLDKISFKFTSFLLNAVQFFSMLLIGLCPFHQNKAIYTLLVHLAVANLNGIVIIAQSMSWRVYGNFNKGLSVGLVNIGYSGSVVICAVMGAVIINIWSWPGIFLSLSFSPLLAHLLVFLLMNDADTTG